MPNVENIRKVIAMIEKEENYFNMRRWGTLPYSLKDTTTYPENVCGTPSCIGGWTEAIMSFERGLPRDIELGGIAPSLAAINDDDIAEWLGITEEQANLLFFPDTDDESTHTAYHATRQQAVAHLEYIIETGEVDWYQFIEKEPV